MRFLSLLLLAGCVSAAPRLLRRGSYGGEMIRGVNLGGWLVLEPWITPSIWNQWGGNPPVDEWGLCAADRGKAESVFSQHWATFITEGDFYKIKSSGLNAVRIPIGYWAFKTFSGDPYVSGQATYLDKAIRWAGAAGIQVYIDLHGAPGSQNGFDNSGHRDAVLWQEGSNVQNTLEVLEIIAKKYASNPTVAGIELLNEPLGSVLDMGRVHQFAKDGFGKVRSVTGSSVVMIHDAFQQPSSWNGQFASQDANVMLDHHKYYVFDTGSLKLSASGRVSAACNNGDTSGCSNWIVVGEWSAAFDDCTLWLNGVGRGSRYQGEYQSEYVGQCGRQEGEINTWSVDIKQQTKTFIDAQLHNMESHSNGWFFWTWKTEKSPAWDMNRLLAAGLFQVGSGSNPCS